MNSLSSFGSAVSTSRNPGLSDAPHTLWGALSIKGWAAALCLQCFWQISRWLGPEAGSSFGAAVLRSIAGVFPHQRQIRSNVAKLFTHLSPDDQQQLTRAIIANFGRILAEYPHLKTILASEADRRIEFGAATPGAALSADRPPAIFIAAHQDNWEILAALSRPLRRRLSVVTTPRSNPLIERLLRGSRSTGLVHLERNRAMRGMIKSIQSGGSVVVLADHRFEAGRMIPFGGRLAATAIGPARLALKLGCDLVPTRIERMGPVRFRITTYPAVLPDPAIQDEGERAVDMMRQVNLLFEIWIRARPEQWICLKRRWPKRSGA